MPFFVYLLLSSDNSTYVGATIDLERRLRQHNSEIKGGAIATTTKVNKGETWIRACHIEGFPDWKSALQFEWRWKQITRKMALKVHPIHRRMIALKQLLSLERPTTKAKAYSEWTEPPKVVLEDEEAKQYYNMINDLNTIS
jgi:predicted GIY-YIG superfamily endonuclease